MSHALHDNVQHFVGYLASDVYHKWQPSSLTERSQQHDAVDPHNEWTSDCTGGGSISSNVGVVRRQQELQPMDIRTCIECLTSALISQRLEG